MLCGQEHLTSGLRHVDRWRLTVPLGKRPLGRLSYSPSRSEDSDREPGLGCAVRKACTCAVGELVSSHEVHNCQPMRCRVLLLGSCYFQAAPLRGLGCRALERGGAGGAMNEFELE